MEWHFCNCVALSTCHACVVLFRSSSMAAIRSHLQFTETRGYLKLEGGSRIEIWIGCYDIPRLQEHASRLLASWRLSSVIERPRSMGEPRWKREYCSDFLYHKVNLLETSVYMNPSTVILFTSRRDSGSDTMSDPNGPNLRHLAVLSLVCMCISSFHQSTKAPGRSRFCLF